MYVTATVISSGTITHKQNNLNQLKWKLRIQKEIKNYRGEISIFDEMSKGVKVKTKKARKIKRKYEITSVDKTLIIKEKPKQKIQLNPAQYI